MLHIYMCVRVCICAHIVYGTSRHKYAKFSTNI